MPEDEIKNTHSLAEAAGITVHLAGPERVTIWTLMKFRDLVLEDAALQVEAKSLSRHHAAQIIRSLKSDV